MESILSDKNLKEFIIRLKIMPEQEKFLLDELPKMDLKERLELLEMLKNVYELNQEESQVVEKVKSKWK
jgi:hypothetical protein